MQKDRKIHNAFISVVTLVCADQGTATAFLRNVHKTLAENFSDYEIILVNNGLDAEDVRTSLHGLDPAIKKDITLINLSRPVQTDNAVVSGLDRANGDYTVIFDMNLAEKADLIVSLYEKTQENFDIVYLQYRKRKLSLYKLFLFKTFYALMRRYSELDIDINEHNCRIISRRALNSILRMRENFRYMRGLIAFVGYNKCGIEADIPESVDHGDSFDHFFQSSNPSFRSAAIAIISFTNILHRILLACFFVALSFSCFVTFDAVLIKLTRVDVFGQVQKNTDVEYLVVLVSVMFSMLFFILYIFSIYIVSINREIKRRPLYFIQSIRRID